MMKLSLSGAIVQLLVLAYSVNADLERYLFTGNIVELRYLDKSTGSIIKPDPDIDAVLSQFIGDTCIYLFNIDVELPGYAIDNNRERSDVPDISLTDATYHFFFCELTEGILYIGQDVEDVSEQHFGMEYDMPNGEGGRSAGVNLISGAGNHYVNILTSDTSVTSFGEWDTTVAYAGIEFASFKDYNVSLVSRLGLVPAEEPPLPIPESPLYVLLLCGGGALLLMAICLRRKYGIR
ncbi:MAG: hypothetical protein JXA18_03470 [Chitinispirillaceae bacterium]|nr:hypothetical protein [Chitinispirillaceae bacterium]